MVRCGLFEAKASMGIIKSWQNRHYTHPFRNVNPETGFRQAEVNTSQAAIRAFAGAGFAGPL